MWSACGCVVFVEIFCSLFVRGVCIIEEKWYIFVFSFALCVSVEFVVDVVGADTDVISAVVVFFFDTVCGVY